MGQTQQRFSFIKCYENLARSSQSVTCIWTGVLNKLNRHSTGVVNAPKILSESDWFLGEAKSSSL
jgi:hypothetical protein